MNEDKFICHKCVSEPYIKQFIKKKGTKENDCSYCNYHLRTISIDYLSVKVHEMINLYYELSGFDYHYDRIGPDANEVIQEELGVEDAISTDIFESLCDNYNDHHDIDMTYDENYGYVEIKGRVGTFDRKWDEITQSLQTEARFFNHAAKIFLDELFSDIHTQITDTSDSVIKLYTTDMPLFRARVFNSEEQVRKALCQPQRNLGPPPSKYAKAGRMNAHGVPVFYGSTSPEIAMAEVRPAVKSHVVMAKFMPLRDLRILDLSALKSLIHIEGSKFDPTNLIKTEKIQFLRTLAYKLTIPILGEVKGHEYLITQAVSEYLGLSPSYHLDGISFDSTQVDIDQVGKDARNIVLFSKSAIVKFANKNDEKREYDVRLYEYEEYQGKEFRIPNPTINLYVKEKSISMSSKWLSERPMTDVIELDIGSLKVHKITSVSYGKDTMTFVLGKDRIIPHQKNEGSDDLSEF